MLHVSIICHLSQSKSDENEEIFDDLKKAFNIVKGMERSWGAKSAEKKKYLKSPACALALCFLVAPKSYNYAIECIRQ